MPQRVCPLPRHLSADPTQAIKGRKAMRRIYPLVPLAISALLCQLAAGQAPLPPAGPAPLQPPLPQPPAPSQIAATVNGFPIYELAVYRGLLGAQSDKRDVVRPEVLSYLIDNMLIDLYLDGMKVSADPKEVDEQMTKLKEEIKSTGRTVEQFCKSLFLTEADLRTQITATTRWEKFLQQFSSEKQLRDFYQGNKAFFDGSLVRARHILIGAPQDNEPAMTQAKSKILELKKQIEDKVTAGMADTGKLDNFEKEKKRMQLLDNVFAETATKESVCESKIKGGDLGMFPRGGGKVTEPFARAAFALKPGTMSDPVVTEYGCHLILCMDFKPGAERKFEEVEPAVKEVFSDRMREAVVKEMRPRVKIVANPTTPAAGN
jgi:peptidyl-prolyl cis-trans isomerase C